MKQLLTIAALLICSLVYGQGVYNKTATNNIVNRSKADSVTIIPRDTTATNTATYLGVPVGDFGRIAAKDTLMYFHNGQRNKRLAFFEDLISGPAHTLQQVTTAGNTTTNTVVIGNHTFGTSRILVNSATDDGASALQVNGTIKTNNDVIADNGVTKAFLSMSPGSPGTPGVVGTLSNHPLAIWTNSAEKMRILANGNVGIGTTSPLAKLTVSNGGADGLEFELSDVTHGNYIQSYNRSIAAYRPMTFFASRFNFGNGNVGIGTTNPLNPLVISNGSNNISFGFVGNTSTMRSLQSGGSDNRPFQITTDSISFLTGLASSSEKMLIRRNGNIVMSSNGAAVADIPYNLNINPNTGFVGGVRIATPSQTIPALKISPGGVEYQTTSILGTNNLTLNASHHNVDVNNTANVTVTLPAITSGIFGREYTIAKSSNNAFTVTVQADGVQTINGSNTYVLTAQYNSITIWAAPGVVNEWRIK